MPRRDRVAKQLERADVYFERDEEGDIVFIGAGVNDQALKLAAPLGTVRELDCTEADVTDNGIEHLKGMKSLKKIRLSREVTGDGIAVLKDCPSLECLVVHLRLDVQAAVRNIGALRQLKVLYFYGDAELRPQWFDSWKGLRLRKFSTGNTKCGDEHLKRLEAIQSLEEVVLDDTRITDEAIGSLIRLKNLRDVCLGDAPVTDEALNKLAELPKLTKLNLGGTKITSRGVKELCKAGRLRSLYLTDTTVDDDAVAALCANKQLESLELSGTRVSRAGVKQLQAALPKCDIGSDFEE